MEFRIFQKLFRDFQMDPWGFIVASGGSLSVLLESLAFNPYFTLGYFLPQSYSTLASCCQLDAIGRLRVFREFQGCSKVFQASSSGLQKDFSVKVLRLVLGVLGKF